MGLRFPNRVGLAAGFDKSAVAIDGLGALGFGFIEIGTVTPLAQAGQPRPRLFRLPAAEALINRLGFPNDGAEVVAARLRKRRYAGIVGVNIGKNATTSNSHAVDDYVSCLRILRGVADYVVVNVSSPNTLRLRELHAPEQLEPLLTALLHERASSPVQAHRRLPLLLKIAPDLSPEELRSIAELMRKLPMDGVVATNTTTSRSGTALAASHQAGGLSGRPLRPIALAAVAALRAHLGSDFPIVGVGGIDSPASALQMHAAGANLVQLYTGLIYRGPGLVPQAARALDSLEGQLPDP